jgi:multidrug transporter EmrE-like cation transporter
MKRMSIVKIIGLVLLVVGVVVLIFGAYNLISYNTSTGGRIANRIAGAFGSRTEAVQNSLITIAAGVVGAVVGFVLYRKG